ncbi:hypothetical protein HYV91_03495 [Candidatus Wolfebacteria bacterium]|nr:hypothetical protein [Candidatus Wolfebacteria bacterium]
MIAKIISRDHYRADACVVWCFDDRFAGLLEDFIKAKNFRRVDLIKVAGGAKDLVGFSDTITCDSKQSYLLDQIAKSIKLHQTPLVILMVHADCGAYGKKFETVLEEQEFYRGELNKAEAVVRKFLAENHLEARIEKYFADFEGLNKV